MEETFCKHEPIAALLVAKNGNSIGTYMIHRATAYNTPRSVEAFFSGELEVHDVHGNTTLDGSSLIVAGILFEDVTWYLHTESKRKDRLKKVAQIRPTNGSFGLDINWRSSVLEGRETIVELSKVMDVLRWTN